jgi:hypothetical protein
MAGWWCLSLISKLDLIWNLAAERHSRRRQVCGPRWAL